MIKKILYTLSLLILVIGLAYVVFVFEEPTLCDAEPCEPTRLSSAIGVVVFALLVAYVGKAAGTRR